MTTSTSPRLRSVDVAARVTTLLARTFREYIPGKQAGFRVESLDHQEPRRMFVRWYGVGVPSGEQELHGPPLGIMGELENAGYAVTLPVDGLDVYVADRPVDTSGPRFTAAAGDVPFLAPWLVVDRWTRVPVSSARTEEEAAAEARRLDRAHVLADARKVVVPELLPFLDGADALLGDGMWWLHQEVHREGNGAQVRRERIDALVYVAGALREGQEVTQSGRMLWYAGTARSATPGALSVRWIPQSSTPAVGYFPGPGWQHGPAEKAAIALLVAAGLQPVVYGETVGEGAFNCESDGFMVSGTHPFDLMVSGVEVDAGSLPWEEAERVPEVLRAAGWSVERETGWPGSWAAYPPAV